MCLLPGHTNITPHLRLAKYQRIEPAHCPIGETSRGAGGERKHLWAYRPLCFISARLIIIIISRLHSANPPNVIRVLRRVRVWEVRVGKQARARRVEAMVPVQGKAWWALLSICNQRDSGSTKNRWQSKILKSSCCSCCRSCIRPLMTVRDNGGSCMHG
jgi:hypothetical protein